MSHRGCRDWSRPRSYMHSRPSGAESDEVGRTFDCRPKPAAPHSCLGFRQQLLDLDQSALQIRRLDRAQLQIHKRRKTISELKSTLMTRR